MAEQADDNPFSQPTSFSDVALVVEGRKFYVCKGILADVSPVFERMFFGRFKEKDSAEVLLPGKKHDEMLEFLLGIYPSKMKQVNKETVEAVMLLADEYQVQRLLDSCVTFLTNKDSKCTTLEMVHFLHVSEGHENLSKVYEYSLNKVARHFCYSYRKEDDEFNELSPETRYKVLARRVFFYETNNSFHDRNNPSILSFKK